MMVIAVSSLLIVLNELIDTIDPRGGGLIQIIKLSVFPIIF